MTTIKHIQLECKRFPSLTVMVGDKTHRFSSGYISVEESVAKVMLKSEFVTEYVEEDSVVSKTPAKALEELTSKFERTVAELEDGRAEAEEKIAAYEVSAVDADKMLAEHKQAISELETSLADAEALVAKMTPILKEKASKTVLKELGLI